VQDHAHEGDIRRFDNDVGSRGTRRNPNGGRGKRGRIVDAVAQHCQVTVLALNVLKRLHLVFRQQFRSNLINAKRAAYRFRRSLSII